MIRLYDAVLGANTRLTRHFRVLDFTPPNVKQVKVDDELARLLELVVDLTGQRMKILTAYLRLPEARKLGKKDIHSRGMAADIRVPGHTGEQLAAMLETILDRKGGIGLVKGRKGYVHVDTSPRRSRWVKDRRGVRIPVEGFNKEGAVGLDLDSGGRENRPATRGGPSL